MSQHLSHDYSFLFRFILQETLALDINAKCIVFLQTIILEILHLPTLSFSSTTNDHELS